MDPHDAERIEMLQAANRRMEDKLAEVRAIAANNHIGGMSVPMAKRLMAIIDGPRY